MQFLHYQLFIVFLTSLLGSSLGWDASKAHSCDPKSLPCWKKCFVNPDPKYVEAYKVIYKHATYITNLGSPCSPKVDGGISMMLDHGFRDNDKFNYAKLMFGIISAAAGTNNQCRPLFIGKTFGQVSISLPKWQCKRDVCGVFELYGDEVFANKSSTNRQRHFTNRDYLNHGCLLVKKETSGEDLSCWGKNSVDTLITLTDQEYSYYHYQDIKPCTDQFSRRILVRFVRKSYYWSSHDRINTDVIHMPTDRVTMEAAYSLATCIKDTCCDRRTFGILDHSKRSLKEEQDEIPVSVALSTNEYIKGYMNKKLVTHLGPY